MKNQLKSVALVICLIIAMSGTAFGAERVQPLWVFPVGATVQSSPAVGADGTIYFGADNGIFYALSPGGKKKWEFVTSGPIVSTPAIAADGTIYVASIDRIVYALNPDGSEKWRLMPGSGLVSSPAIAPDGTLYVGSVFNKFFAIGPDGFRKWDFPATGNIVSSPAVDANGNVYFGCMDTNFYAVNTNGAAIWVFKAADKINSSPAIDGEGNIYFGGFDRSVYALSQKGQLLWEFKTDGAVRSSPIIGDDGTIYVGCDDGKLYAIDRNGKKRWDFATRDWVRSTPALSAGGTIYFGSYDGGFYAVNTNGSLVWSFQTDGHISSSPIIGSDGTVYVGSWDKNFYAFKSDAPLADTPWAAFRKNLRRTGCVVSDTPLQTQPKRESLNMSEVSEIKFKPGQKREPPVVAGKTAIEPVKPGVEQRSVAPEVVQEAKPQTQKQAAERKIEKPIVKIIFPKNGTRFSEPQVVVEGSARHSVGLKAVEFRLNSGPIYPANGLGRWNARISLNEGDNIFEVRGISITGAQSDWERIILHYVPVYQIILQVNGSGKVSPSVAGKKYESGQKVVLIAEPQRGFVFTGWSGSVLESSPRLEISIRSNIFLQANFAPMEKPTQKPSETVAVKEEKNRSEKIASKEEEKVVEKDRALSSEEAVLRVKVMGNGTVSPYSGETRLKVNKVYKLVAKPETGFVFAGWKGDIESSESEIKIYLKTNIDLVANFVSSPFYSKAGDYSGLIYEKTFDYETSGLIQITVSDKGSWKARLTFANENLSCEGKFDEKLESYAAIKRGSKAPVAIVMRLDEESNIGVIHGRISGIGAETMFLAKLNAADTRATLPIKEGYYTMTLLCATNQPNQVGDGFAQIRIDKSGKVRIEGKLGDDTSVFVNTALLGDGFAPVFGAVRNQLLVGWLVFTNSPTADIVGELNWIKSAKDTIDKIQLRAIGSIYKKPQKSENVLNATNLVVAFSNGGIGATIGNYARLEAGNKISVLFSEVNLSLSIDAETGVFKGSFVHPTTKKAVKYEGVVLQKRGWGSGFFNCEGKSGLVFIAPENMVNESAHGR
ncbi:MAG: PQQ-binding-like beta-propeller repeat protein [Verrucomicrobiia bacterium]